MALYAFDGTWNIRDRKGALSSPSPAKYGADRSAGRDTVETNVHRFMEFYGKDDSAYIEGVGTKLWWLGRALGGGFGAGGKRRVRKMYRELMERYHAGDTNIDIIGFSRGASMAVHFTNLIHKHGVRRLDGKRHRFLWYYKELGITFRHPKEKWPSKNAPDIDLLGLWDTVATFGFPIGPLRNKSPTWDFDRIAPNVKRCFHAMALDEVRATFELVQLKGRPPTDVTEDGRVETVQIDAAGNPKPDPRIYAVWFRGVHSNIGGGYVDRGLSDITLAWIMEQAEWAWNRVGRRPPPRFTEALAMLHPDAGDPPDWTTTNLETLEPDPNGKLGRPADLLRSGARPLGPNPLVHHSVRMRAEDLMSDHYSTKNKQLLRRVPKNVQYVYDPPITFEQRKKDVLTELALSGFVRVPVNPRDWLMVGADYVYRSDDWIGYGPIESRNNSRLRKGRISQTEFVAITKEWVVKGRPTDPDQLVVNLPDPLGRPAQPRNDVLGWAVAILGELDEHMPWSKEIADLAE